MPVRIDGRAEGRKIRVRTCRRVSRRTRPTSSSSREAPRTPSQVLTTTGVNAASATNTTLAASPTPNHIEISGIQAKAATCFSPSKDGPSSRSARRDMPSRAPSTSPAAVPIAKPARSRARLAARSPGRSPRASSRRKTVATVSSGGRMRGSTSPPRLAASQATSSSTGGTAPLSARRRRDTVVMASVPLQARHAPALEPRLDRPERPVHGEADDADQHHRDDHRVEPEHLPAPDQQVAEPLRGGQELDRDERQPGLGQAVADAGKDWRHGGRQDDL